MKVTLINYTADAVNLLLFTKQTRLNMTPGLMAEIAAWPAEKKAAELAYMARTIRSSWEFIDYTFLIEGVTRAIAQQITRTRTASFAMQSMRVTDVREMEIDNPFRLRHGGDRDLANIGTFDAAAEDARIAYKTLVDNGAPLEDARGILPLNTTCNLVAKYNLRSLVDVVTARSSLRAQGPYAQIARDMRAAVLNVHPEFFPFFNDPREEAFGMLEAVARELGITPGKGPAWEIAKAVDLLRKQG